MNARDELAEVIGNFRDDWYKVKRMAPAGIDRDEAAAILAAGYRKTRPVTTPEGIDALPHKTVVLTGFGDAVTIYRSRRIPAKCYHFLIAEGRTATVIHEPKENQ